MNKLLACAFVLLLFMACKKQNAVTDNCASLQQGMVAGDIAGVGATITNYINTLPSNIYTEQNLQALAGAIRGGSCNITATIDCFNCIKTLPAQTEIQISFSSGGTTISKTIDITYTANNVIRFNSMHD
jgi:riboflavin transporter FmnP